ncbi:MAG: carbon-nitrogen hydrolase family protein [Bradymonadia bacterium]
MTGRKPLKICLAQLHPVRRDLDHNLALHLDVIERAAKAGADLVLCPELSLVSYEPEDAAELAMKLDDTHFDLIEQRSAELDVVTAVGAPLEGIEGVTISMIILQGGRPRRAYAKQLLHTDELPYFVPGPGPVLIEHHGHRLAPAICYESVQPEHARQAVDLGATVYGASVAKPGRAIDGAHAHYRKTASDSGLPVVFVNSVGPCDNFVAGGRSAAWNTEGQLLGELSATAPGCLMVDLAHERAWIID